MTISAQYSYAVNHLEAVQLLQANGDKISYVFEGEPGAGKSSLLKTMQATLGDKYDYIYVDLPTKDIPDIALSMPDHEHKVTVPYMNTMWLGDSQNPDKPKVIMLDELFKCTDYVRLLANRLLLERMVGTMKLPEGSIVFGTSNFQSDGVGDRVSAHTNSRVSRVHMRKPAAEEWMQWAYDNNIHEFVLTWVKQNPQVFSSYKDTEFDASLHNNGKGVFRFIYHPQHNNSAYVCPRTLELASHQLHNLDMLGSALTQKGLVGTVGMSAALDIMTYAELGRELPAPQDIEISPDTARVPTNGVAKLMLVYKSLQFLNAENIDAYSIYFDRLGKEIMSTWVKTLVESTAIREVALRNQKVRSWAIQNSWVL